MDIRLYEKLRAAYEVVAAPAKADPQKVMKDYYKKVLDTKLTKSTWPSTREGNQYKFWLLQDGTLIPVVYSHNKTLLDAGLNQDWFSFIKTGAVGGYINLVGDEIGITSGKKLTSKQIVRLKNLWLEYYKIGTLYVDVPQQDFNSPVKSSKHLDYLLNYGPMDEAVATEVSPEKRMRDFYKKEINGKLKGSTWTTETDWYKFWMFKNGDYVPVDYSHSRTAGNVKFSVSELETAGMIQGSIKLDQKALSVTGTKSLTRQQISRLRQFYIEYKPTELYVSMYTFGGGGIGQFSKSIVSSADLDYTLEYGLDESKSEEDQKEQFFVDRTNKHILLVQGAADKILKAYPEYDTSILRDQLEVHDASKLEEPERTPYVEITWRHKLEKEEGEYDPYNGKGYQTPGKLEKEDENEATLHHITTNSHHPEYHLENKSDANVNKDDRSKSDKCVDASLMPPSDIVEMIADWQAMSEELKTNTAREWFEKQKDVRWHFTEKQEELIDKLLKVFEEE